MVAVRARTEKLHCISFMTGMIVRQFSWGLRGDAPAKLNLSLEVLAKRNDGFHEIETFMVPVNLYDTL